MKQSHLARLSAVALLSLCACAFAADPKQLKPEGYVSDFAHALDASSRTQLERYCETVEKSTGVQMAVVTITTLGETPIEDFANELFHQWGVGEKKKDEGVMLLLSIRDRKNRIEVGYGLEPVLPDGFVGSVLREMRPSLREGNYGQALIAGTAEIGERIAESKGVTLDRTLPRRDAPRNTDGGGFPIGGLVLVLAVLFLITRRGGGGGFLTGMILGNLLGGSRYRGGGWGGGGFGGYSDGGGGGGGFGGFGGGDSGGGGASGSW